MNEHILAGNKALAKVVRRKKDKAFSCGSYKLPTCFACRFSCKNIVLIAHAKRAFVKATGLDGVERIIIRNRLEELSKGWINIYIWNHYKND